MREAITLRTTLLGVLSWLVPFLASVPFFDRSGQLLVWQPLFKSIMAVIGGLAGVALLVTAFRRLAPQSRTSAYPCALPESGHPSSGGEIPKQKTFV